MVNAMEDPRKAILKTYDQIAELIRDEFELVVNEKELVADLYSVETKKEDQLPDGRLDVETPYDISIYGQVEVFGNLAEKLEKAGYEVTIFY